jgi:hypothetical protein
VAVQLTVSDLLPFAPSIDATQAIELISGTLARAKEYAPCILDPGFTSTAAAKDIIRAGVLRRYASLGGQVVKSQSLGDVSITYDNPGDSSSALFTDTEIFELKRLCPESASDAATPSYGMPDPPDEWPEPAEIIWTVG